MVLETARQQTPKKLFLFQVPHLGFSFAKTLTASASSASKADWVTSTLQLSFLFPN